MRNLVQDTNQGILTSECGSCSWKQSGQCDGPIDAHSYLLQGDQFTSCLDTVKREQMFGDTFKYLTFPATNNLPVMPNLPRFIPTIKQSGMIIPSQFADQLFGISLGSILEESGDLNISNVEEIRDKFRMGPKTRLILIGTSSDPKLEKMWKRHRTEKIFERIANLGFECATSSSFSVWAEEFSRPDQLRNFRRNLNSYDLLIEHGLPCIPFLFPIDDIDFVNLQIWLKDRKEIGIVAVYARYCFIEKYFQRLFSSIERIEKMVDRPLKFLICGIGKPNNISRLRDRFDCIFENTSLSSKAIHGMCCDQNLNYFNNPGSREELFTTSLRNCLSFAEPRPIIYLKEPKIVRQIPKEMEK